MVANDADGDVLLYELGGTNRTFFDINRKTGQILTKVNLNLNGDADLTPEYNCGSNNVCQVTVKATDPSKVATPASDAGSATVNITVTSVNEAPTVSVGTGDTKAKTAMDVKEFTGGTDAFTLTETLADYRYIASDPENEALEWSASGPDGDLFAVAAGVLSFKDCAPDASPANTAGCPNFEERKDADTDNVYEVTVVAADPGGKSGMLNVTIKVENMEENGTIELSTHQPQVGRRITAKLKDGDGNPSGLKWQWMKGDTAIVGSRAKSETFMPTTADVGGDALKVKATYTDPATPVETTNDNRANDTVAADPTDGSKETETVEFTSRVIRAVPTSNEDPYFREDDDTDDPPTKVTAYTRHVQENRAGQQVSKTLANAIAATIVTTGGDVTATDTATDTAGQDTNVLFYELGGTSEAYFELEADARDNQTAVIKTTEKLDHETKATHTVTVTATDPSGRSATVTVTIKVADMDENTKVTGPKRVDYAENTTGTVATFKATDEDEDDRSFQWDFSRIDGTDIADDGTGGANSALFNLNGHTGVLTFKKSPDYEEPKGGTDSDNPTNAYTVTVRGQGCR